MKYLPLLFCFLTIEIFGQSYEGYIGNFPVWFDIEKPIKNEELKGVYFYKNQFKDIELKGKKTGELINLSEYNSNGKITGLITLTDKNDSLIGKWTNSKNSIKYDILLYKTDSKYKPCEKLNYGEVSVDSSDGIIMGRSGIDLEFASKNVVSYREWSEYYGAYMSVEFEYHTIYYDSLCNQQGLGIWSEIDSSKIDDFRKYLNIKMQECMYETRRRENDSTWTTILQNFENPVDSLDKVFNWTDAKWNEVRITEYFDSKGLKYIVYDYFHFPHALLALDLFCGIYISYSDLKQYLKYNSVICRFIKKD
jgi:hypothetical protein